MTSAPASNPKRTLGVGRLLIVFYAVFAVSSTARASFYFYNTREEVDRLVETVEQIRRYFAD